MGKSNSGAAARLNEYLDGIRWRFDTVRMYIDHGSDYSYRGTLCSKRGTFAAIRKTLSAPITGPVDRKGVIEIQAVRAGKFFIEASEIAL